MDEYRTGEQHIRDIRRQGRERLQPVPGDPRMEHVSGHVGLYISPQRIVAHNDNGDNIQSAENSEKHISPYDDPAQYVPRENFERNQKFYKAEIEKLQKEIDKLKGTNELLRERLREQRGGGEQRRRRG